MRVADFFCGSGGFSEGFRQAGFEIVFAVDKWEPAVATYKGNKPKVKIIQDDVIRISQLGDEEFEQLVPDSEIIIGSPPCQAFSNSNKSGNADKTLGIKLIEAYLKIIARKKYKNNSVLRYWILENVPSVKDYIKEEYTARDLNLEGNFILKPHNGASGKYNAKYFGAPTNRERYLCGEFPKPCEVKNDNSVVTLKMVLDALGKPLSKEKTHIKDINYPDLILPFNKVSDHNYIYALEPFEWQTAKRLKQDKGYMGKMSFPENLDKPSRTVMATMSASSRESMILGYSTNKYRLPTVREVASMMSFPIDYRFYGKTKATKHTLVGNAVPPKMSYALAKAIAKEVGISVPKNYIRIRHDKKINFLNLNGITFEPKLEKPRRDIAKFKYHIPYLILSAYRVELTNYYSCFNTKNFKWSVEIHYSQGKSRAAKFQPQITLNLIDSKLHEPINNFMNEWQRNIISFNSFQKAFCMTSINRAKDNLSGPYELLNSVKCFIHNTIPKSELSIMINIKSKPFKLPLAIIVGYFILNKIIKSMGGLK
jgi:DNA (cytosine-5)-methyltransferase 1